MVQEEQCFDSVLELQCSYARPCCDKLLVAAQVVLCASLLWTVLRPTLLALWLDLGQVLLVLRLVVVLVVSAVLRVLLGLAAGHRDCYCGLCLMV